MDKEQVKLIIFDMDGVILDSEPLHENARQVIFQKLGVAPGDSLPDPVGKSSSGFWRMVLKEYQIEGDPYELEAEQYHLVAKQVEDNCLPPSKGLLDVMEWAKKEGLEIGLASSSSRMLVDDALRLLHLETYFDYTVSGNEVDMKKPAPDVYMKVLKMAGLKASDAVAVEDSATGIEAARRAGIYCYGYQNKTSGGQDVSKADQIIESLKEIIQ